MIDAPTPSPESADKAREASSRVSVTTALPRRLVKWGCLLLTLLALFADLDAQAHGPFCDDAALVILFYGCRRGEEVGPPGKKKDHVNAIRRMRETFRRHSKRAAAQSVHRDPLVNTWGGGLQTLHRPSSRAAPGHEA